MPNYFQIAYGGASSPTLEQLDIKIKDLWLELFDDFQ